MHIGIDNISPGESTGLQAVGGMRTYVQAIVREFCRMRPAYKFSVFVPRWSDLFEGETYDNLELVRLTGVPRSRPLRVIFQQTALNRAVRSAGLNALFAPATVLPLRSGVPTILAIQFLQFYEFPEAYGRLRTLYLKQMVRRSVATAHRTIIFSESAKRDLMRHTGIPDHKVVIIPHGLSDEVWSAARAPSETVASESGRRYTGGAPYILYVSATYKYKNHVRLIQAFAKTKKDRGIPHKLLLVGAEAGVPIEDLASEARRAGVGNEVIITGRIEHAAMLYRDAAIAAVPSLYETFGFPLLEAMACGCPLVTSNRGAMAELAGDAAVLVDPFSVDSIAEGIVQALANDDLRRVLIERGRERAQNLTWSVSAARTLSLLEEVAGCDSNAPS